MKKSIISIFIIFLILLVFLVFYNLSSKKNIESSTDVTEIKQHSSHQITTNANQKKCINIDDFNFAYKVKIDISANANQIRLYHSSLSFNAQFEKDAHSNKVKLYINQAVLVENELNKKLKDTVFSTQIEKTPYLSFVVFDTLSMPPKHPLQSVSQLLKALSVGQENRPKTFNYDQLSKLYQYTHHEFTPERTTLPVNTNSDDYWRITLDDQCVPSKLESKEAHAVNFSGGNSDLSYTVHVQRIPNFMSLADIALDNQANANHFWTPQDINSKEFAKPVTSLEEMLAILENYEKDKSSAKLARGADFIINNLSPSDMSELMLSPNLSEDQKRLLAYAMSLTDNPNTENFMLETINLMPANQGEQTDVQTMRLMVSISSYENITQRAYDNMRSLNLNNQHSNNIRNNALVSMGTMVNTLDKDKSSGLRQSFNQFIEKKIDTSQGRSAILAAGNAKLTDGSINQKIIDNLKSEDQGRRYAAATVLARNENNYDQLINTLASERSIFVINTIVNNIDKRKLNSFQKQKIKDISSQIDASSDKYKLLSTLYGED